MTCQKIVYQKIRSFLFSCFFFFFFYKQQICFSVSYKDTYGQVVDDSYEKKEKKKKKYMLLKQKKRTYAVLSGQITIGNSRKKRLKCVSLSRTTDFYTWELSCGWVGVRPLTWSRKRPKNRKMQRIYSKMLRFSDGNDSFRDAGVFCPWLSELQ